jgi:flagellar protein FliS
MTVAGRYASTQNETASKNRMLVLLLEAALRHIRAAAKALDEKASRDAATPLKKATDIVTELMTTLDRQQAPELVDNLTGIYMFVSDRLLTAGAKKDPAAANPMLI